jgi:uncharacterized protein (UPF0548 family)
MRLFFRRPSSAVLARFVTRLAEQELSYGFVSETRGEPALRRGWKIDRERVLLGHGEGVFRQAIAAIDGWQMFPPEITDLVASQRPASGLDVAVLYWAAPLAAWMLFPLRVVYVTEETVIVGGHAVHRYGFANGTLRGHAERGEERFLVEWNTADDSVWYELLAVSRPAHWLARLGYFYARREQARFRKLSAITMRKAVMASQSAGQESM